MATSTHLAEAAAKFPRSERRNPLVLWHLLSLDAPTVAALWTWFLARTNGVALPLSAFAAIALAVWILYVTDRLLDTRPAVSRRELEERHYFHRAHCRVFLFGLLVAALVLAALVPRLSAASIRLYLALGALLSGYFALIHSPSATGSARRLPKELAVGVFFSAAVFIPTVSRRPELRLILLPAAILFAILCSLNCLYIYAWEHPVASRLAHPATRISLRFLPLLTAALAICGFALSFFDTPLAWQIPAACAIAALLLLGLHASRDRIAKNILRAAADLCLLTPILFLPLHSR